MFYNFFPSLLKFLSVGCFFLSIHHQLSLFLLVSLPVLCGPSVSISKLKIAILPKRFWSLVHRGNEEKENEY